MKPKIGILYIATGRYWIFWEEFYRSAEKYFLADCQKEYFVFSDTIMGEESRSQEVKPHVHYIYQEKLGWPYDTLKRFDIFLRVDSLLKELDYLFFCNANMEFVSPIFREDLFLGGDKPLLAFKHPGFVDIHPRDFTYDRNPLSRAYIPVGEGSYYCMGGLNGGRSFDYLRLCRELKRRIDDDERRGVMALWHDESHLNRYVYEHKDSFRILEAEYGVPEERIVKSFKASCLHSHRSIARNSGLNVRVIIRDKSHPRYGGHNYLRGVKDHRDNPFKYYVYKLCAYFFHKG